MVRKITKKIKKICINCNKEYMVWNYRKNSLFCSNSCKYKYKQIVLVCHECGKKFVNGKTQVSGKLHFCSRKCRYKNNDYRLSISESQKGKIISIEQRQKQSETMRGRHLSPNTEFKSKELNPHYKGGTSKIRGNDWVIQRRKALERDKFTCKRCGIKNDLIVHHIVPYKISKDNSLENLITLCRKCHIIHERRYSKMVDEENSIIVTNVPKSTIEEFKKLLEEEFEGNSGMLLKWLMDFRSGILTNPNQVLMEQMEELAKEIEQLKQKPKKKTIRSLSGKVIAEKEE